jgi:hypothetical protein
MQFAKLFLVVDRHFCWALFPLISSAACQKIQAQQISYDQCIEAGGTYECIEPHRSPWYQFLANVTGVPNGIVCMSSTEQEAIDCAIRAIVNSG